MICSNITIACQFTDGISPIQLSKFYANRNIRFVSKIRLSSCFAQKKS